jgi:hypothetical protein
MYQPKTTEDYLELVDQAIFEVEDLIRCAEEEDDAIVEFASQLSVYQELVQALQKLRADVVAGTHPFGNHQDLPFMPLVRQWRSRIPFHVLLGALNTAHKEGF